MLRIKSAQYMNMQMPPKALPMQFDDGLEEKCKLPDCNNPSFENEDFCENCIRFGPIKKCSSCYEYRLDDEGVNTDDGRFVCLKCARRSHQRQTYYNGPYEGYER